MNTVDFMLIDAVEYMGNVLLFGRTDLGVSVMVDVKKTPTYVYLEISDDDVEFNLGEAINLAHAMDRAIIKENLDTKACSRSHCGCDLEQATDDFTICTDVCSRWF